MLTSLLVSAALAADCPEPRTTVDLLSAMEVAEDAWSMADAKAYNAATESIDGILPCITDPITRATAARIHRMQGMNRFLQRDPEGEKQAFAAARFVQPGWQWPADLVPVGHPVLEQYVAMPIDSPNLELTPKPLEGTSWFDGRESLERPKDWPTIHQHMAPDGNVMGTWLLQPGDSVPDYPRQQPPKVVAEGEVPAPEPEPRGLRRPLLIGAASGLVASAVLYGLAGASSSAYRDGSQTRTVDEMDKLRRTTNTRYWASVGLAGASTATAVSAFAVARW